MGFDLSRSLDGWRGRTCAARRSRIDMVAIVAPAGGSPSADQGTAGAFGFVQREPTTSQEELRPTRVGRAHVGRMDVLCCGKRAFCSVRSGTRPPSCSHATRSFSRSALRTPARPVERPPECRTVARLRLGVRRTRLSAAGTRPRDSTLRGGRRRLHGPTTPPLLVTPQSREAAPGSGCRACAAMCARTSTSPGAAGPSPSRRRIF